MNPEWPIYPMVRQTVRNIARAGALTLTIPPLLFLIQSIALAIIACGETRLIPLLIQSVHPFFLTSRLTECAGIFLATLTALWSHDVLLAHRGSTFTRMASIFTAFLALLWLASALYTPLTGEPLFIRQHELPLWTMSLLLANILFNLHNMAAAPLRWRLLLILFPITHLIASILASTRTIPGFFIGDTAALISNLLAALLLFKLSQLAPKIVSMPRRE